MFGMGTGGSLRLLSPETLFTFASTASALPGSVGPPFIGRPAAFLRFAVAGCALRFALHFALRFPHPPHLQNRTGRVVRTALTMGRSHFTRNVFTLPLRFPQALPPDSSPLRFPPAPFASRLRTPIFRSQLSLSDQALDRLVSSSSTHCCASTDDLSTLSSSRGLTCF